MVSDRRMKRMESEILKVAATALEHMKDPKLRFVTITGAELRNDLKVVFLKYVSHEKKPYIEEQLKKASGLIRLQLSREINLRYTPEVSFKYDEGMEYQMKIDNIFKQIDDEKDNS